ncbi:DUF1571 domain-containing protein [Saprospiraceae bacterium]|nr:DUF1571 domain-containing protein [Saprospiraceae bacterium]
MDSSPDQLASPPNADDSGNRASGGRRLIGLFGLGLMVVIALVTLQRFMLPEIDESQTAPVVISHPNKATLEESSDPNVAAVGLPKDCLTAHINQAIIDQSDHPLDPVLDVARDVLESIDWNIRDYTATMASQVLVDGELQPEKYLFVKIRHEQEPENGTKIPFAAYTKFLKPQNAAGQEALWVEGQNDDKLIAHAAGLLNLKRVYLDPNGAMAMKGNRYPIQDIGFRNLIAKIVDHADEDRHHPECQVTLTRDVDINGRNCTMLEVTHAEQSPDVDFHLARFYLDDERNIPIAYEAYLWPAVEGEAPPLLEKYFYSDIQLNAGLTDADFDPSNEEYNYPAW